MAAVNADPEVPALAVFPEGGTSNGLFLLRFKRGAFEALSPIKPVYAQYYSPFVNPGCETVPMHLHYMFMTCQPFSLMWVKHLPTIFPTDYMYEKYKDWGKSKVEIYAEVVRDIYSTTFGVKKADNSLMQKVHLNAYLYGSATEKPKLE